MYLNSVPYLQFCTLNTLPTKSNSARTGLLSNIRIQAQAYILEVHWKANLKNNNTVDPR